MKDGVFPVDEAAQQPERIKVVGRDGETSILVNEPVQVYFPADVPQAWLIIGKDGIVLVGN